MNRNPYSCPILHFINSTEDMTANIDNYPAKYVAIGYRTASPEELNIRRTAQDLKIPTDAAIELAAPAMAAFIDGPGWLVPAPASDGSLIANLALTRGIAEMVPGVRVKCAVGRAYPVKSSRQRRLRGLPRLTIDQHAIIRTAGPMQFLPVFFVDNVITTGTTIAACRRVLGLGSGLAYADASKPLRSNRRITFGKGPCSWSSGPSPAWQVEALHDEQVQYAVRQCLPTEIPRLGWREVKDRTLVYPTDHLRDSDFCENVRRRGIRSHTPLF